MVHHEQTWWKPYFLQHEEKFPEGMSCTSETPQLWALSLPQCPLTSTTTGAFKSVKEEAVLGLSRRFPSYFFFTLGWLAFPPYNSSQPGRGKYLLCPLPHRNFFPTPSKQKDPFYLMAVNTALSA